jgi:hypothetical protein
VQAGFDGGDVDRNRPGASRRHRCRRRSGCADNPPPAAARTPRLLCRATRHIGARGHGWRVGAWQVSDARRGWHDAALYRVSQQASHLSTARARQVRAPRHLSAYEMVQVKFTKWLCLVYHMRVNVELATPPPFGFQTHRNSHGRCL